MSNNAPIAVGSSVPASDDYQITISNCNSVSSAEISLRRSALNIKYGPNGIGKSTISRALRLRAEGADGLAELTPFKYRDGTGNPGPSVTGADDIQHVLVFDDEYVRQFVFQRDEVLKDSFEIFINTEDYRQGIQEIESMFLDLKGTFSHQPQIEEAIANFTDLRDAFSVTKTGAISKASRGIKALNVGGKLEHIPEQLAGYKGFLHSSDPAGWVGWQSKGTLYLELSDNCPFCSTAGMNKDTAKKVSEEYETAAVKNMSALRGVIDRIGHYFESSYLKMLNELTTQIAAPTTEQTQFLAALRGDVETLLGKLTALRNLSFQTLRDEKDVAQTLGGFKINLPLLTSINSDETRVVVDLINGKLDDVTEQIGDIQGRIGKQKSKVARLIKANQDEINEFLKSAGYRYSVQIEPSQESYRMILEHQDAAGHLESAAGHLSYGEKNAFALILFMHHVRKEQPDLVVFDDPVSSFDKTKKFAIFHQLFRGKHSLRDFTTLLLTHDIEPAIDIVKTGTSRHFTAAKPVVHFLSSRRGVVSEKLIQKSDLSTFSQVCDANIDVSSDDIIKCIYLRRRYEVHGKLESEYDVLSSLLHVRETPSSKAEDGALTPIDGDDLAKAVDNIRKVIPSFEYGAMIQDLQDSAKLKAKFDATDVGYEKLQLFRVMSERDSNGLDGDDVFHKFVNESFHIENEYVMQLNPREFDTVPEYIIDACSALVAARSVV